MRLSKTARRQLSCCVRMNKLEALWQSECPWQLAAGKLHESMPPFLTSRLGPAGQMLLAVMMKTLSQGNGNVSLLKMIFTRRPKRWQRARRHQRKANTSPPTPYPPVLTPRLRAQGPSQTTLRKTGASHPTEARPQRILGNTTGTSSRRPRCGARGRYRRSRVGLLVVMVGRRLVSSLVLHAVSGSDHSADCTLFLKLFILASNKLCLYRVCKQPFSSIASMLAMADECSF